MHRKIICHIALQCVFYNVRFFLQLLGRKDGGIDLIDVYKKYQSLLISSFVKMYCNESQMFILTYYYMYEKVNGIIVRERKNIKVSHIGSPFYRAIYKVYR